MSAARTFLLCSLLLTAGCADGSRSASVISRDRFADIYLDLLIAGGRAYDSTAAPIRAPADSILNRWGTEQQEYRNTVNLYNRDPETWRAFFAEVIRKGTEREDKATEDQRENIKD